MMRRSRMKRLSHLWPLLLLATACAPVAGGGVRPFTYDDSRTAIHQAFGAFGPVVEAQAIAVASCESGLWPYSGITKRDPYYRGIFQLGKHIIAIQVYGGQYYDPYQNALAARDLYVSRGNNWSAWTCQP